MDRTETTKVTIISRSIASASTLLITVLVGLSGCTTNNGTAVTSDASPASPPAQSPSNKTIRARRDAPTVLMDAGEFAENIYDAAKGSDWKTVDGKLAALKSNAQKMQAQKLNSPDFDASLVRLDTAITSKDRTNVLIEANRLTLEGAELSAKFNLKLPVEVVKLDYYGRELEIWSAAKNDDKLHEAAALIRQNWDSIKPKIVAKGGAKQASVFEALVVKADTAKTPQDFARIAKPILDEVDNLEKVFD